MSTIAIDARVIPTSTGRYVERLIHYLEEIDTTNHYVILVRGKDRDYYVPKSPRFSVMVAEFDNYSLAEQYSFLKLLNTLRADLVHFCMPQQPILYKGAHVTTVHDLTLLNTYNSDKNWLVFHLKQLVGTYVFRRVAHSSSHIITPSEYTKAAYVKFAGIDPGTVTVTYEAADITTTAEKPYKELAGADFLLYVGQQSDYKNIRRLIEAHQELRKSHQTLELVLVGALNEAAKRNQRWVIDKGFKGMRFTGFVDDTQLAWLYGHCRAYVFPSLMEGFGLPGLEAMGYGAPVVSSNATCLPEIYGDAALYFDPMDVAHMVRAIDQVLVDDSVRMALIKKGTLRHGEFSWRRMAEQTLAVYERVLNT